MPPGRRSSSRTRRVHDVHRGLLSRVFTPKKMDALEPQDPRVLRPQRSIPLVGAGGFDFVADLGAPDADAHDRHAARHPRAGPGGDPRPHRRGPAHSRRASRWTLDADGFAGGEMFAEYIDWRAEHPSDDLMTELLNAEFEDETGTTRHAHPRRDPHLRQRRRRRRQRDHHPPHRLDRQGARRAPRPAAASSSRTGRSSRSAIEELLRYEPPSPGAGPLRRQGRRVLRPDGPGGQRHGAAHRLGQPRRPPVPRRRPLRHPPRRSATTSPSATASTSASAPRWPASRAGSRSTRCCNAVPRVGGRLGQRRAGPHLHGAGLGVAPGARLLMPTPVATRWPRRAPGPGARRHRPRRCWSR